MAAKLKDIAVALNVNSSTVSRALRGDPRVKEATSELIRKTALEMGYRPNLIARSLAEGCTKTVWMLMAGLTSPIEREPAEFATRALFDAGYDMLVAQHRNHTEIYERLLGRLREGVADGALIIPASGSAESIEEMLIEFPIPIVFIDRHPKQLSGKVDIVTTDNENAAYNLTKSVISSGASSVWVGFTEENEPSRERKKGAERAISEMGAISSNKESLGIVANSQGELLKIAKNNSELPFQFGGTFDSWIGNVYPFKEIYLCTQNFQKMAEEAVRLLLLRIQGKDELRKQILKIEHLNLSKLI